MACAFQSAPKIEINEQVEYQQEQYRNKRQSHLSKLYVLAYSLIDEHGRERLSSLAVRCRQLICQRIGIHGQHHFAHEQTFVGSDIHDVDAVELTLDI